LYAATLQPDDMLLLTSDGLTRYAHTEEIAHAAATESDLTKICSNLIEYAKQRGGADNITCILLKAVPAQVHSAMAQSNVDSRSV
jgi:protein phosphatase